MSPKEKHSDPKVSVRRRQKQKADTRRAILHAARQLFDKDGFADTTIRVIAAEAEVGVGTIFTHFPDKQSLLVGTVIDDLEEVQRTAWETVPKDAPLLEQLLHLAAVGYRYWGRRPSLTRAIMRETYFVPGPARDQLCALDQEAMAKHIEHYKRARQRGELSKETDPELLAHVTFSLYFTTVMMGLDHIVPDANAGEGAPVSGLDVDAMIKQTRGFLELLFRGIGGRE